jgi:hypothetical protein
MPKEMTAYEAMRKGERELRRAVRIAQVARAKMANELKRMRSVMQAHAINKIEVEIRRLDRVIEYGSRVLSWLPEPAAERFLALREAFDTLSELSD